VLNFSYLKTKRKDTLITKNKNGRSSSIRYLIWTPNNKKFSIK